MSVLEPAAAMVAKMFAEDDGTQAPREAGVDRVAMQS
jgi:hypothetical protein